MRLGWIRNGDFRPLSRRISELSCIDTVNIYWQVCSSYNVWGNKHDVYFSLGLFQNCRRSLCATLRMQYMRSHIRCVSNRQTISPINSQFTATASRWICSAQTLKHNHPDLVSDTRSRLCRTCLCYLLQISVAVAIWRENFSLALLSHLAVFVNFFRTKRTISRLK